MCRRHRRLVAAPTKHFFGLLISLMRILASIEWRIYTRIPVDLKRWARNIEWMKWDACTACCKQSNQMNNLHCVWHPRVQTIYKAASTCVSPPRSSFRSDPNAHNLWCTRAQKVEQTVSERAETHGQNVNAFSTVCAERTQKKHGMASWARESERNARRRKYDSDRQRKQNV